MIVMYSIKLELAKFQRRLGLNFSICQHEADLNSQEFVEPSEINYALEKFGICTESPTLDQAWNCKMAKNMAFLESL